MDMILPINRIALAVLTICVIKTCVDGIELPLSHCEICYWSSSTYNVLCYVQTHILQPADNKPLTYDQAQPICHGQHKYLNFGNNYLLTSIWYCSRAMSLAERQILQQQQWHYKNIRSSRSSYHNSGHSLTYFMHFFKHLCLYYTLFKLIVYT